jgi:hypothetical protein
MFLRLGSPISTNSTSIFPRIWRNASSEIQMPPGSAMPSSRAAILTPSPYTRAPSYITSPRLTPIRYRICRDGGSAALRSAIVR